MDQIARFLTWPQTEGFGSITKVRNLPLKFFAYAPHFQISFETPRYTLHTATRRSELLQAFQLRQALFLGNDGDGTIDTDEFDYLCDHLVIQERESGDVVGTYRLLSSEWSHKFYSQGEFRLEGFLASPGVKLELGRACIHPDHRNGVVIDLLWKGIGRYAQLTKASCLFGCSSVKTISKYVASGLYAHMRSQNLVGDTHGIRPTAPHCMGIVDGDSGMDAEEVKQHLPPLLRSYFSAGARVHGPPAVDEPFDCIDFLTVLELDKVSPSFARRYFNGTVA